MKYLLKNKTTGEEHLCDKVVVDGFEYYVNNEKLKDGDWFYDTFNDNQLKIQQKKGNWRTCFNQHKIIATNNPNIDSPQVIDEIVYKAYKAIEYGDENLPLVTAWCDGYLKSKEETSFSEEDMIDFNEWYCNDFLNDSIGLNGKEEMEKYQHLKNKGVTKELLEIWKRQKPKTIWYE